MSALRSFRRRNSRRFWAVGATLVAAAAFGVFFVAASGAAGQCPTPGNFEIDGDMTQQTCTPPADDWDTPGIGVQSTTQGGTYKTAGKDNSDPSTWQSSGSTPNKTNFAQAYATSRVVNGHFFVYVAWERTDVTGTQGYAIEITNSGSNTGADGTPQPNRTGGGAVFYISSQGSSAPAFDGACSYTSQSDYGTTCTNSDANVTMAINTAPMSDPLNGTTQPAGAFFEVAMDVTGLTGVTPSCPGSAANAVYLRSITGQTSNGNLKGYMAPLEVAPDSTCAPPPITTTATPGGSLLPPGTAQHDEVTVGTDQVPAAGTVDFFLCSPAETTANGGDCSANGTQVGSSVTLDGTGSGSSDTIDGSSTPDDNTPGKYCWRAEFTPSADDHNYLAASHTNGTTECFFIAATPSVTTTQDPPSGAIGDTYNDTAHLADGLDPTGTITFDLYDNPNCSGDPLDEETATVNGNGDYSTPNGFVLQHAGDYYWVASYGGDDNNLPAASGCADEHVVVNPNQPSVTTTQDPASGVIGQTYNDTAHLAGGASPTGTITFDLYDNPNCSGDPLHEESVAVDGNGDYSTSAGFTINNAGDYYWVATYNGDSDNLSAASGCADEKVVVAPNQPAISTTQDPPSGAIGDTYKDTAHLSDGVSPTGTITFDLYDNSTCSGEALDEETVAVDGNGDYSTPTGITLQNAGDYYWVASYNGDSNNLPVASGCADEKVVVNPNQPTITTQQDPASGSVGDLYKDKATLAGSVNQDGSATITWNLYDNNECSGEPLDTETVSVDDNGTFETPDGVTLNTAGTYYWVASFSGDPNNLSASSGCADEQVVVKPAAIHILKTADAAKVDVGSQIGFTLTVYNTGEGDAHGVKLDDTLPVAPGVSWSVASTGSGWGSACTIDSGVLHCGGANGVTVPAGTTTANSKFTVHIVSGTTGATGGDCPTSGVITNIGHVTSSNDGSDQSTASTCVQALVDLSVTKSGSPATQELGQGNITWTIVVTNNGPSADTGVSITDPMPAGNTFVSATSTKGTCTGGAVLTCNIGPMAVGEKVTITLVTTPSAAGTQTNTVNVSGNRPETNTGNNSASASVEVTAAPKTPPVVYCVAVSKVNPKQLFVGRKTMLTIHLTKHSKAIKGIHVRIKGPKVNIKTKASNSKGVIKQAIKLKKAGVLVFTPIASKSCNTKRVGVTNVFTPPVTG